MTTEDTPHLAYVFIYHLSARAAPRRPVQRGAHPLPGPRDSHGAMPHAAPPAPGRRRQGTRSEWFPPAEPGRQGPGGSTSLQAPGTGGTAGHAAPGGAGGTARLPAPSALRALPAAGPPARASGARGPNPRASPRAHSCRHGRAEAALRSLSAQPPRGPHPCRAEGRREGGERGMAAPSPARAGGPGPGLPAHLVQVLLAAAILGVGVDEDAAFPLLHHGGGGFPASLSAGGGAALRAARPAPRRPPDRDTKGTAHAHRAGAGRRAGPPPPARREGCLGGLRAFLALGVGAPRRGRSPGRFSVQSACCPSPSPASGRVPRSSPRSSQRHGEGFSVLPRRGSGRAVGRCHQRNPRGAESVPFRARKRRGAAVTVGG